VEALGHEARGLSGATAQGNGSPKFLMKMIVFNLERLRDRKAHRLLPDSHLPLR
jgi:hypothetical protein